MNQRPQRPRVITTISRGWLFLWLASVCMTGRPDHHDAEWRHSFAWYLPVHKELVHGAPYLLVLPWDVLDECTNLSRDVRIIDMEGRQWPFFLSYDETDRDDLGRARAFLGVTAKRSERVRVYYGGAPSLEPPFVVETRPLPVGWEPIRLTRRLPSYAPELERSLKRPLIWMGALVGVGMIVFAWLYTQFRGNGKGR